jgi:hypothetical protein
MLVGDLQSSKHIPPWKLRGLRSILLYSSVDFQIADNIKIAKNIEIAAAKVLTKAGVSLENEQGSVLAIEVELYPIEENNLAEYALVQVSTELVESVRLLRRPSPRKAIDGITWSRIWVSIIPRADIIAYILKEAGDQVDDFVVDLKWAEGR